MAIEGLMKDDLKFEQLGENEYKLTRTTEERLDANAIIAFFNQTTAGLQSAVKREEIHQKIDKEFRDEYVKLGLSLELADKVLDVQKRKANREVDERIMGFMRNNLESLNKVITSARLYLKKKEAEDKRKAKDVLNDEKDKAAVKAEDAKKE